MRVQFCGFWIHVPDDLLKHSLIHTGADGVGDVGVPADVHGDLRSADFFHDLLEFSLGEIVKVLISLKPVNQLTALILEGFLGFQTVRGDQYRAICTGFGLASSDEIIVIAVHQRNREQFVGAAATGQKNQDDIFSSVLGLLNGFHVCL